MRFPPLAHALDWFVPKQLSHANTDLLLRARLAAGMSLIGIFALLWASLVQVTWGTLTFGLVAAGFAAAAVLLLFALRRSGSLALLTHVLPFLQFTFAAVVIGASGGKAVWALFWLALVPLNAVLLVGARAGVGWGLVSLSSLLFVAWLAHSGFDFPIHPTPDIVTRSVFRGAILSTIATLGIALVYESLRERALSELATERQLAKELEASIAQRERAERAQRESEERYRIVVETASDPILAIDADSQILFANRAAEQTFGYTIEELMAQPLTMLMVPELRQQHRDGLEHYVRSGLRRISWKDVELRGLDKEGREIPLEVSFGEQVQGEQRLFIGVARDVSERKRYESELRDAAAELERRNAELRRTNLELEEFTSVASHDLQEPLRKLVSFSGLLRDDIKGELPPDAARDLEFISDGAHRMQQLVRDLLALSRAGMKPIRLEPIAVADCVESALEDLELRVRESDAHIERCALPELAADPTLLTGIYRNLLGNALKFSGGGPPQILLTAERSGGTWILGVADSGVGLPPGQREEVFKPFRRLQPAGHLEGSGIGLSFCRRAVERHGGRIWIESEPGAGSHFRFTLQASRVAGPEEP